MKVPFLYPFDPPEVRFLTKIFHPNVSRHGDIGIDSIEKSIWVSALTLSKVNLFTLLLLLENIIIAFNFLASPPPSPKKIMIKIWFWKWRFDNICNLHKWINILIMNSSCDFFLSFKIEKYQRHFKREMSFAVFGGEDSN